MLFFVGGTGLLVAGRLAPEGDNLLVVGWFLIVGLTGFFVRARFLGPLTCPFSAFLTGPDTLGVALVTFCPLRSFLISAGCFLAGAAWGATVVSLGVTLVVTLAVNLGKEDSDGLPNALPC